MPGGLPRPGGAADLPGENIVFQQIAFLAGDVRQAAFEIGEHALVAPSVGEQVKGGAHQRGQGPGEDIRAGGGVQGDAAAAESVGQRAAAVVKAAHGHGDIPPAAAALPDETQSLGGGQFALLGDGRRGEHSHAVPGGEGGVGPAEKMGLEKTHGRFRRAGGDVDAE